MFPPRFALIVMVLLLVACKQQEPSPPLPEGEQVISGILFPTEISLVRRGTHVLRQDSLDTYYLESTTVNLRSLEQREVTLKGVFEQNIRPDMLPVFVVLEVIGTEELVRLWTFRELKLSLEAPKMWGVSRGEGRVQFLLPAYESPVLTLLEQKSAELPEGTPIVVDRHRAVRMIDEESGDQTVSVQRGERVLKFLFTPGDHPDADALREEWLAVLRSVLLGSERTTSEPTTATGAGMPCGGGAGILCPSGQYCEVVDLEENIGKCVKM